MNEIKVKFCGLTSLADVAAAAQVGAHAAGFVFVPKSPRFVDMHQAKNMMFAAQELGLKSVALFANQKAELIAQVVALTDPDVIQFHGDESAAFCEQFHKPYWKAVPMLAVDDFHSYIKQYPQAEAYLLDAYGTHQMGGSGNVFNWFEFPDSLRNDLILAGGIHAENVHAALAATSALFIDTSSGIETAPGVKSKGKMKSLMDAIKVYENQMTKSKTTI